MKCPNCKNDVKITFLSTSSMDNFYCRSCNKYSTPERTFVLFFLLIFALVFYGVNFFFHKVSGFALELPKGTLPFFIIPNEGPATFLILVSICTLSLTYILSFLLFKIVGKLKIRDGGYLRSSTIYFVISIFIIIFMVQMFSYQGRKFFM